MKKPIKIWQRTDDGKTTTVSVWDDKKVRTGYYEPDFWSTLNRSTVPNLTDEEWAAAPGPDWKEVAQ
jgi:hypothetical protein